MIFDINMGLCDINLKSISDEEAFRSTIINVAREAEPIKQSNTISHETYDGLSRLVFSDDCINVRADKKDVIVIARNIAPLISSLVMIPEFIISFVSLVCLICLPGYFLVSFFSSIDEFFC